MIGKEMMEKPMLLQAMIIVGPRLTGPAAIG